MSKSFCRARPSRSASAKASHTPIIEMPRIEVVADLGGLAVARRAGMDDGLAHRLEHRLARAKPASLPPTMKVRLAAAAPATPPETGASSMSKPRAAAAAAAARDVATSMVEQSTSSAPVRGGRQDAVRGLVDLAHLRSRRQHGDDELGACAGRDAAAAPTFRPRAVARDVIALHRMAGLRPGWPPSARPYCRAR